MSLSKKEKPSAGKRLWGFFTGNLKDPSILEMAELLGKMAIARNGVEQLRQKSRHIEDLNSEINDLFSRMEAVGKKSPEYLKIAKQIEKLLK